MAEPLLAQIQARSLRTDRAPRAERRNASRPPIIHGFLPASSAFQERLHADASLCCRMLAPWRDVQLTSCSKNTAMAARRC
jgi:hypothetical protein